jgi:ketosteroid isomerase-like protein
MSNHPNFDRAQAALDAIRQGDPAPTFDLLADDIEWENGPGAGPWYRARGKDDWALMLMEFGASLGGTFHQDGRCIRHCDARTRFQAMYGIASLRSVDRC